MSKSIRLHPEHGVNPSIEQAMCPICGKTFDTGSILMMGMNRGKEASRHTVTHLDLCPDDKQKLDDGYIALVAIDPEKSDLSDGLAKPESAYRTGALAHIRRPLAKEMLGIDDPDIPFVYVDEEVIKILEAQAKRSEKEGEK